MEIATQPRIKAYPQNKSQSFHKTTKQERMQQYFNHFLAKYKGRTSLQAPAKSQHKSTTSVSAVSAVPSLSNVRWSSSDFIYAMPLSIKKTPTQRIGNFSYPKKGWKSQGSNLDHANATTLYSNNQSKGHNYHPNYLARSLPGASKGHRSYPTFSGSALPKWNHLYKAYKNSS